MNIEIIIHLKSGGKIAFGYCDKKIQSIVEHYSKVFTDKETKVLLINDEKNFQIIPKDNIASISISEVD